MLMAAPKAAIRERQGGSAGPPTAARHIGRAANCAGPRGPAPSGNGQKAWIRVSPSNWVVCSGFTYTVVPSE